MPLLRSHFLLQPGAKTRGRLVLPLLRSQFLPQPGAQTTSRKQSLLIRSFFRSFLRLFCPAVHELGTVLFELRQGSPSLRREIFLPVGCASLLAPSSVLALGSLLTLLAALPSLTLSLALSFRAFRAGVRALMVTLVTHHGSMHRTRLPRVAYLGCVTLLVAELISPKKCTHSVL